MLRILDRQDVALDFDALGFDARSRRTLRERDRAAARHRAGHRPDRQRQDHDALCGAQGDQHAGQEDPHRRGSRSSTCSPASTRCRSSRRSGSRSRNALRSFLRQDPDVHHGRRDPRSGNGGDRDPGGAHRSPGALDAAHQHRRRRGHAVCSTWASTTICSPRRCTSSSASASSANCARMPRAVRAARRRAPQIRRRAAPVADLVPSRRLPRLPGRATKAERRSSKRCR